MGRRSMPVCSGAQKSTVPTARSVGRPPARVISPKSSRVAFPSGPIMMLAGLTSW